MTEEEIEEQVALMQAQPPEVRAMLRRFPPQAKVRTVPGVALNCPPPGSYGLVVIWKPDLLTVISPAVSFAAECRPDQLEVMEYVEPFTPDFMARVLPDVAPAA